MGNQTTAVTAGFGALIAGALVLILNIYVLPIFGQPLIPDELRILLEGIFTGVFAYFFPNKPKVTAAIVGGLVALAAAHANAATVQEPGLFRIVVGEKVLQIDHEQFDENGEDTGFAYTETATLASAYFAPMVTVSVLRLDLKDRANYRAGVVPGVGYGFHWSPAWYDKAGDSPFLSAGVFLEGGLVLDKAGDNFAAFTVLPAVTLMRWFSVGLGWEQRFALTQDGKDDGSPILALGVASTF